MTTISTTATAAAVGISSQTKLAAIASMFIGAFIIFMVGFSHIDAVHNAAHDTRHSFAFPCH